MFSFIKDYIKEGETNGESAEAIPPIEDSSKLTAEELRKIRLEKLGSGPDTANSPLKLTVKESSLSVGDATHADARDNSTEQSKFFQMPKPPAKLDNVPKSIPKAEAVISTTPITPPFTPSKMPRVDKSALNTNIALEGILLITMRRSAANGSVKYFGNGGDEDEFLTLNNVSELICTRLSSGTEFGGAIGYLNGCYKRLLAKGHVENKLKDDLSNCRNQLISFAVSALMEPEMFGENSANAVNDLYQWLAQEGRFSGVLVPSLLKELTDELVLQNSLSPVMQSLIGKCFSHLCESSPSGRSIMDSTSEQPTDVLVVLCQSDKRLAAEVASSKHFLVSFEKLSKKPPPVPSQQMLPPHLVDLHGAAGAAIESHTIIGRILSVFPNMFDPKVHALLGDVHRQTKPVYESNIQSLRSKMKFAQSSGCDILLALLKAGGVSKDTALKWLTDAIAWNVEAEKGHPSQLLSSSSGFLINLGVVLLSLSKPVFSDLEKLRKVDWRFFREPTETEKVFPADFTHLTAASVGVSASPELSSSSTIQSPCKITFATQSFFMCWRALHLGYAQQCHQYQNTLRALSHYHAGIQTNDPNSMHFLLKKVCTDAMILEQELLTDVVHYCAAASQSLLWALETAGSNTQSNAVAASPTPQDQQSWLMDVTSASPTQKALLASLPEHLIDDLMTMLYLVGKTEPARLNGPKSLDSVLSLILFFLRRPWSVQSPHLRAKFGQVLFQIFLPHSLRDKGELWSNVPPVDGPHNNLLSTLPESQRFLSPALLLLYGDVERTGFYEKLTNRRSIMIVLKHLWTLPTHRAAFRGIAAIQSDVANNNTNVDAVMDSSEVSAETAGTVNYFIRFANGLMNETNALVSSTLEKLSDIRKTQLLMANAAEWAALGDEGREQVTSRLQQSENEVRGSAGLCLETVNMLNYLTSDEMIRLPFLLDEILPRFTSMLLSVLNKIVGSKGLEIKVDNMSSYNFDPKTMLKEICQAMIHFESFSQFWEALVQDGFFEGGETIRKALATVTRLNLLTQPETQQLSNLYENAMKAKDSYQDLDKLLADAPDEFLDPLLLTIMRDPVELPTSGNIVDRSTIAQHLLNDEKDPFNRQALKLADVVPLPDLKKRIEDWLNVKKKEAHA